MSGLPRAIARGPGEPAAFARGPVEPAAFAEHLAWCECMRAG